MKLEQITIMEALQKALDAHSCGNSHEAESIYSGIIKIQPNHPDANHNMGLLACHLGKFEISLKYFRTALEANPRCAQFWLSYVDALTKTGKTAQARNLVTYGKSIGLEDDIVQKLNLIINRHVTNVNNKIQKNTMIDNSQNINLECKVNLHKKNIMNSIVKNVNCGNYMSAEKIAKQFILDYPNEVFGYKALGAILIKCSKSHDAFIILTKGLKISNGDSELYNALGKASKDTGNLGAAINYYKKATEIDTRYAEAYYNMGIALHEIGNFNDAILAYEKSLSIKPDLFEAYYNIANALQHMDKTSDSLLYYEKSLKINPEYAEALNNMGNAFQRLGKLDKAILFYKKALKAKPNLAETYNNMGNALTEQENFKEAIHYYKASLEYRPRFAEAYNNMGNAYQKLGKLNKSITCYKRALKIQSDYPEALSNLGNVFLELGKINESICCYENALNIKSDFSTAYYGLCSISKYNPKSSFQTELEKIINKSEYADKDKMNAHFALGELYSRNKKHSRAFENYTLGHKYRYKINKSKGVLYNNELLLNSFEILKNIFNQNYLATHSEWSIPSDAPIFIVGFPRSGTSLIEQILASHSLVFGAGELKTIPRFIRDHFNFKQILTQKDFSGLLDSINAAGFASSYVRDNLISFNTFKYFTDKMPHNFENIWLIQLLFPNSKILHCIRGAEDTCISCYFNKFTDGHAYIDDLRDLAKHYKYYKQVMSFWKSVVSMPIHDISYEFLVNNQEDEIRRLLSVCGLNFEQKCFEFYKTKRPVRTASASQVREPMYTSSVGKWRRYEQFLGPFLDELYK